MTNDNLIIGYQGVEGANSHEAAMAYFGADVKTQSYLTFEDAFVGLSRFEVENIVLPIENSCTGSIAQVYDLITQYGFFIVGEKKVRIRHHLMAVKGSQLENIKQVYSHVQGFEQCTQFFKTLHHVALVPYYNTAYSAKHVAEKGDGFAAAVASEQAAIRYGLDILAKDIQDHLANYTRFVIIGRNPFDHISNNKISLTFSVHHTPGSLYSALEVFHKSNINLLKIESRPIKAKPWEYAFYIDITGNLSSRLIEEALQLLSEHCVDQKVIGSYIADDDSARS